MWVTSKGNQGLDNKPKEPCEVQSNLLSSIFHIFNVKQCALLISMVKYATVCILYLPQPKIVNFIFLPQTSPHLYGTLPTKKHSAVYWAWTRCTRHLHMHTSDAIRSRSQRVQTPFICFSGAKLCTCWPADAKRPPPLRGALMEADECHSRGALLTRRPMCWGRWACTPRAPSKAPKLC